MTPACAPRQVDPDSQEPQDELDGDALTVAEQIGSEARTVSAARECPKFREYINDGIKRANANAASRAQRVNAWRLLERDLSLPAGDLTPTLKLKRNVVGEKHAELIESIYAGAATPAVDTPAPRSGGAEEKKD